MHVSTFFYNFRKFPAILLSKAEKMRRALAKALRY